MARFKIALSKQYGETEKAYTFRDGGRMFSIPKSQITSINGGTIKVEEKDYSTACYVITLNDWMFGKIEEDLNKLSEYNYKLLNQ